MHFELTSYNHEPIRFQEGIPEGYRGMLLPGAKIKSAVKEFGTILLQEVISEQYAIRLNIYQLFQKIKLRGILNQEGLHSILMLKNNFRQHVTGIGKIHLREGQFVMLHANRIESNTLFEKEKEYRSFDAWYSMDLLQQLAPFFPRLHSFISKVPPFKSSLLIKQTRWASPVILDTIHQFLECPFEQNLRRFYFENKIREYLFLLLVQTYETPPVKEKLSEKEVASVYEARDYIQGNIGEHSTIPEISKRVNLNEFKLKNAFKQIFGMGIFESLLHTRMKKARELLLETDKPIKEIALITGYERITSFITAFRKHFGYTPGALRRK